MKRFVCLVLMLLAMQRHGIMAFAAEHRVEPGDFVDARLKLLRPGDTLVVAEGVYTQSWTIAGLKGAPDAPITIRGKDGAVLRPATGKDGIVFWGGGGSAWVVLDSLRIEKAARGGIVVNGARHITIRNCVLASNGVWGIQTCLSDHITVENCEVYGSVGQHGIYFSTTDHPVVSDCGIYNNAACGIHLNGDVSEGGDGMIFGGMIRDNTIYDNGRSGGAAINMDGVMSTVVRSNLLFDNHAGGIAVFHQNGVRSGEKNEFHSNTVYFQPKEGRYGLQIVGGAKGAVVKRNILVCGIGPALDMDRESLRDLKCDANVYFSHATDRPIKLDGQTLSLNDWRSITGQDRESVVAAPEFIAPFRLAPQDGLRSQPNKKDSTTDYTDDTDGEMKPQMDADKRRQE